MKIISIKTTKGKRKYIIWINFVVKDAGGDDIDDNDDKEVSERVASSWWIGR